MELADHFVAIAHRVVWCSVATVDRRGRPRSRVLHPVWERTADGLVGWVGTRATPLKRAHLATTPYVSCSYWDPRQDIAVAECAAAWVPDEAGRRAAWERFLEAPEPVRFDFSAIFPDGPGSEAFAVLRLEPWRLRVHTLEELTAGRPATSWRAGTT